MPDWFEPLDRLLAGGQLAMASMADAQFRASQAAVLEQEIAGIDVITGGEMDWLTAQLRRPAVGVRGPLSALKRSRRR